MEPTLEHVNAKTIIGVSLRTSNERESHPDTASIPIMWRNFFEYNVMGGIPEQVDSSVVYGVYSDYESDQTGEYDLLIGLQSTAKEKPANYEMVTIQEGKYLVFPVLEASPVGIKDTWAGVEGYFDHTDTYKRAFTTDFEIYQGRSDIAIYISVL